MPCPPPTEHCAQPVPPEEQVARIESGAQNGDSGVHPISPEAPPQHGTTHTSVSPQTPHGPF